MPLYGANPCMQSREVQRVGFTQMIALMIEVPRLTLKAVMNFKILIVIHCLGLLGRVQTPVG